MSTNTRQVGIMMLSMISSFLFIFLVIQRKKGRVNEKTTMRTTLPTHPINDLQPKGGQQTKESHPLFFSYLPSLFSLLILLFVIIVVEYESISNWIHQSISSLQNKEHWKQMEKQEQYHTSYAYCDRFREEYRKFYESECSICLDPFHPMDPILELKCGCQIIYHRTCIIPWLQKRNTCPICRRLLFY